MANVAQPQVPAYMMPLMIGVTAVIIIVLLLILVIIPYFSPAKQSPPEYGSPVTGPPTPPGGCKCISDVKARSPGSITSDQQYELIESKDNMTFCGFEQNGYKWGCKPSDCTPACT